MKRECKNREKCTGVFEPNSVKQINFVNKMYDVSLRIQSKCRRLQHFFFFFQGAHYIFKKSIFKQYTKYHTIITCSHKHAVNCNVY